MHSNHIMLESKKVKYSIIGKKELRDDLRAWSYLSFAGRLHKAVIPLQSYAEGFEILKASPYPDLDLGAVCDLWMHGSVIRSWLLDLAKDAFKKDPHLDNIVGYVEDSGEGRWTVQESIEHAVPAPVIMLSLCLRFRSRQTDSFSMKVLAALRNEFGGHAIRKAPGRPTVAGVDSAGAAVTHSATDG